MDGVSAAPRVLSFPVLNEITKGFSKDMKVGAGSYGDVYKGQHTDGEMIAVKVLHYIPGLDDEQFQKEYCNLANLQHENIVRLIGYCHETFGEFIDYKGQKILAQTIKRALCFEYMQNGSLDSYIADESTGHGWSTRYAIIKGICQGLKYLHEELVPPLWHLDLKPGNILLDDNMVPKIADFGLSRLFGGEQTQMTKSAIGTPGYVPPEYIDAALITAKFDIFSLGVMIIKIITGPKGYFRSAEMSPRQFIELVHGKWKNKLQTTTSDDAFEPYCEQVKRCIEIALSCVDADRHKRPSIGVIIDKLNETETAIQLLGASLIDTPGSSTYKKIRKEDRKTCESIPPKWGAQDWIRGWSHNHKPIIDIFPRSSAVLVDWYVRMLLENNENDVKEKTYLRIQAQDPLFGVDMLSLDDASSENMRKLVHIGDELLQQRVARVNLISGRYAMDKRENVRTNNEELERFARLLVDERMVRLHNQQQQQQQQQGVQEPDYSLYETAEAAAEDWQDWEDYSLV